jgi:hypothetical protein
MTEDERNDEGAGTGEAPVHRTTHDFDERRALSMTVIEAIEEATELSEPSPCVLSDVVDPDCLDGLFRPVQHRTDRAEGTVRFPVGKYRVTVHADGEIVIYRREDG